MILEPIMVLGIVLAFGGQSARLPTDSKGTAPA